MHADLDIFNSINSGQVFLWRREDRRWLGVNGDDVLEIDERGDPSSLKKSARDFFRLDDDYAKILADISRDPVVRNSVGRYRGLRLLRQDPFQCYITFIVSANSSIPNIKTRLERLCSVFGKEAGAGQDRLCLFPTPQKLAKAPISELLSCGLGYRAKFVKSASELVSEGRLDLESLRRLSYEEARAGLVGVAGIGNKVADCIMLFSLEKLDAFPLDTWILKALDRFYAGKFRTGKSLTDGRYLRLHEEIGGHFGEYAGFAQQFLFKTIRDQSQKRWLQN